MWLVCGTGELGYDRLNGTRKIGPSYAKSVTYIWRILDVHRTGTKHMVRHMQKSVVQWSFISKFAFSYIIVLASRASGCHLDTQTQKSLLRTTKIISEEFRNISISSTWWNIVYLNIIPIALYTCGHYDLFLEYMFMVLIWVYCRLTWEIGCHKVLQLPILDTHFLNPS